MIGALLAFVAGCSDTDPPPLDAAPSMIPTSIAGRYQLTSTLDFAVPAAAAPVLSELRAATDGADDPTRYLLDRMIATLPDGTTKTVAEQVVPYVAAYLNARLSAFAPRLAGGLDAIAAGTTRLASHLTLIESLQIDERGDATRTLTGLQLAAGSSATTLTFANGGIPDASAATHVALDGYGHLAFSEHAHEVHFGSLLKLGLDLAVIPGAVPGTHDLAAALGALLDCAKLGDIVADRVGIGPPSLYETACRAAMTALASEIDAELAAIDRTPLAIQVSGTADAVDLDGDGTMDALRTGRWAGSLRAAGASTPIGAATFAGGKAP